MASAAPPSAPSSRQLNHATASQSQTQTQRPPILQTRQPVLHLRGAVRSPGERTEARVQWAEDVVDNEGLGRKSSKVCCIYHAPKPIDESSDESSSDDSSDESGNDDGGARPVGGKRHEHGHRHDHDHAHDGGHGKRGKGKGRARSPNAYEKLPRVKNGSRAKEN